MGEKRARGPLAADREQLNGKVYAVGGIGAAHRGAYDPLSAGHGGKPDGGDADDCRVLYPSATELAELAATLAEDESVDIDLDGDLGVAMFKKVDLALKSGKLKTEEGKLPIKSIYTLCYEIPFDENEDRKSTL